VWLLLSGFFFFSSMKFPTLFISLVEILLLFIQPVQSLQADFNEAFASSILSTVESLVAEPWDRVLNIAFAAYSSGPSYLYVDKHQDVDIDKNNTRAFLWNLFKPVGYSIDWAYIGLVDSSFTAYTQPNTLVTQVNRNYSLTYYVNSTDKVSGRIDGPPSATYPFDCTGRPVTPFQMNEI
jgi:hypothetical protein